MNHRLYSSFLAAKLLLLLFVTNSYAAIPDRPVIDPQARVKQHRFGANGDLVEGEEELRKIIVYWPRTPGALGYEICHNCNVDDAKGVRLDDEKDKIKTVGPTDTCGGEMCGVYPGAPLGKNTFNVRVQTSEGWSLWSKRANFVVDEPGHAQHVSDEL